MERSLSESQEIHQDAATRPISTQDAGIAVSAALICLIVFLSAMAYSFHLVSFLHAKEFVLCLGLIALGLFHIRRGVRLQTIAVFLPLWLFLAYAVLVHFFFKPAKVPNDALISVAKGFVVLAVATFAVPVLEDAIWRERVFLSVVLAGAVAAFLATLEYAGVLPTLFPRFSDNTPLYSVFGNADLFGGYLAAVVPLLAGSLFTNQQATLPRMRRIALLFLLMVVVFGLTLSGSRGAWIAGTVGLMVLIPSSVRGTRWAYVAICLCLVSVVSAFVIGSGYLTQRAHELFSLEGTGLALRLWFWDGTIRMARDHLLWGVGLGNFAYWSPQYLAEAIAKPYGMLHQHNDVPTLFSHADALQLLAETGIVGCLFWIWMVLRVRMFRSQGTAGASTALLVFSLSSFPFHSVPHALLALLCVADLWVAERQNKPVAVPVYRLGKLTERAFPIVTGLFAVFLLWAVWQPSVLLKRADTVYFSKADNALDAYEQACQHPWQTAAAHRHYATALLFSGKYIEAEEQIRRALERSDIGQLHLALGVLEGHKGNMEEARSLLENAVYRIPSNIEAWRRLFEVSSESQRENILERARTRLSPEAFQRFVDLTQTDQEQ